MVFLLLCCNLVEPECEWTLCGNFLCDFPPHLLFPFQCFACTDAIFMLKKPGVLSYRVCQTSDFNCCIFTKKSKKHGKSNLIWRLIVKSAGLDILWFTWSFVLAELPKAPWKWCFLLLSGGSGLLCFQFLIWDPILDLWSNSSWSQYYLFFNIFCFTVLFLHENELSI